MEEMKNSYATVTKEALDRINLSRLLNNAMQRLFGNRSSLYSLHVLVSKGSSNRKQPSWNRYRIPKLLFLIVALTEC